MPPLIGESQNIGYLTPCSERGMTRLSSKMDLYGTHEDFLKMRGTPKASQLGHVLWRNQWFWGSPPSVGDDTSKINHGSIIHITSLHMSIDIALSENKVPSNFGALSSVSRLQYLMAIGGQSPTCRHTQKKYRHICLYIYIYQQSYTSLLYPHMC